MVSEQMMAQNTNGVLGNPNPTSSSILGNFQNARQPIVQTSNPFRNPFHLTSSDFSSSTLISLTLTGASLTAHDLWMDLKNRYSTANPTRDFELVRAISTIKQGNSFVTEYYSRIKALWDELSQNKVVPSCKCGKCQCGVSKMTLKEQNKQKLMQFLMGLDYHFEHVTNQILMMDPLLEVSKAFAQISQLENRSTVHQDGKKQSTVQKDHALQETLTLSVQASNNFSKPSYNNTKDYKPGKRSQNEREKLFCKYCKKTNHNVDKCFKLVGYPPDYEFQNKRSKQGNTSFTEKRNINQVESVVQNNSGGSIQFTGDKYQHIIDLLKANMAGNPSNNHIVAVSAVGGNMSLKHSWIIDTGASDHVICIHDYFHTYRKLHNSYVTLPNGRKREIDFIGDVRLGNDIILTGALHVKDFIFNLISASKLVKKKPYALIFDESQLQDTNTLRKSGMGIMHNELYYLHEELKPQKKAFVKICSIQKDQSWHKRLGHPSARITGMLGKDFVDTCNSCSICIMAKMKRNSFSLS
ncbi:uncharacterized protein LOC119992682 [Tripterygium wilfordii]|uniref:uncharacterized protein LOC119992682 n=1 Tax=Tripterygium wilfordii TaxID=458696 RepID=UPI0018F84431|nr:uncharacterized protein LOC119992682 [Tripterygium wilfordii]